MSLQVARHGFVVSDRLPDMTQCHRHHAVREGLGNGSIPLKFVNEFQWDHMLKYLVIQLSKLITTSTCCENFPKNQPESSSVTQNYGLYLNSLYLCESV